MLELDHCLLCLMLLSTLLRYLVPFFPLKSRAEILEETFFFSPNSYESYMNYLL